MPPSPPPAQASLPGGGQRCRSCALRLRAGGRAGAVAPLRLSRRQRRAPRARRLPPAMRCPPQHCSQRRRLLFKRYAAAGPLAAGAGVQQRPHGDPLSARRPRRQCPGAVRAVSWILCFSALVQTMAEAGEKPIKLDLTLTYTVQGVCTLSTWATIEEKACESRAALACWCPAELVPVPGPAFDRRCKRPCLPSVWAHKLPSTARPGQSSCLQPSSLLPRR